MNAYPSQTENPVSDKAACLNCGFMTANYPRICDECCADSFADCLTAHSQPSAINFGDDVTTQTTAAPAYAGGSAEAGAAVAAPQAVPVGNTGTTSTGRVL